MVFGIKGGISSFASNFSQSISLKKAWRFISSAHSLPHPILLLGDFSRSFDIKSYASAEKYSGISITFVIISFICYTNVVYLSGSVLNGFEPVIISNITRPKEYQSTL